MTPLSNSGAAAPLAAQDNGRCRMTIRPLSAPQDEALEGPQAQPVGRRGIERARAVAVAGQQHVPAARGEQASRTCARLLLA